jgi:hypothetical protein
MITEKAHQRYPPSQTQREKGDKAMIARFDHRPMLTALLALTTTVLVVVVVTLTTLLITAAPPAATSASEGGANPGAAAAVPGTGDNYGEGWNNYGHDEALPQPAQAGNGADSAVDRHAEVVAAYQDPR